MWAVGALVYAMAVGDPAPVELGTQTRAQLVSAVSHQTGSEALSLTAHRALDPDPSRRPSMHQVGCGDDGTDHDRGDCDGDKYHDGDDGGSDHDGGDSGGYDDDDGDIMRRKRRRRKCLRRHGTTTYFLSLAVCIS